VGAGRGDVAGRSPATAAWVVVVTLTGVAATGTAVVDLAAGRSPEVIVMAVVILAFPAMATVILHRYPTHAIGWCLLAVGFLNATGQLSMRVLPPVSETLVVIAAWYGEWYWIPMVLLAVVVVPMVFPTGRPPSPAWRPVLWVVGAVGAVAVFGAWVQQELAVGVDVLDERTLVANPIGVAPWADVELAWPGLLLFGALFPAIVLTLTSLVVRARRAGPTERQQLKWGALGVGVLCGGFLLVIVVDVLFGLLPPPWVGFALMGVVPVSFAVAVTRTRLYDIDRIISRSVAYLLVTLLLGLIYAGSVVALQPLLRPITGTSDLAVATSTLVVAASFGPLRRRVQSDVDQRFNRRRVDRQRAVEAFASRLRAEVSLAAVSDELRGITQRTLQPAGVAVWLRPLDAVTASERPPRTPVTGPRARRPP
jgi:hypothetical protein